MIPAMPNSELHGDDQALVELSRERIEKGSKSFAVAAKLFDPATRASAYMLYAWCRHCDDVVDDQTLGHKLPGAAGSDMAATAVDLKAVASRVRALEDQTRKALAGETTDDPVFQALARVCARHDIPHQHPFELLEGFRMDAEGRRYETIDDTLTYCYHVAGVVGVMMAYVMGVRDERVLDRASDLGLAFQLTNIARDVVPDAKEARVYLPEEWLREAGLERANLAHAENREALARVVARLLDTAQPYYGSASIGIGDLPMRSAWAVATARAVYREIGVNVRKLGPRAWDQRTSTSRTQKLAGVADGLVSSIRRGKAAREAELHDRSRLWTRPRLRS